MVERRQKIRVANMNTGATLKQKLNDSVFPFIGCQVQRVAQPFRRS
jgi:hypothetical protein